MNKSLIKNGGFQYIALSIAQFLVLFCLLFDGCNTNSKSGSSGVAWGKVFDKIEGIKSFVYRRTVYKNISESEGIQQTDVRVYFSSDYGCRIEDDKYGGLNSIMIINTRENSFVSIIPVVKKYSVSPLSQEKIDEMINGQDPRQIIRQMLATNYTKLGQGLINGIEVEGIKATGQKVLGGTIENATVRLWVESGTDFPVLLEIDGLAAGSISKMGMVIKDFQWDTPLEESFFVPNIPADYTSIETENGTE